jgi:hypothetical protein
MKPKHYKYGLKVPIYKNTTDLHAQNSGNASTVDSTKGNSNLQPLHADGFYSDGGSHNCGDYSSGTCGTRYDGTNYPGGYSGGSVFCGPWTPRPPVNMFAKMDALLSVVVTNGGTGYTDGALMSPVLGYAPDSSNPDDRAPTFRIKCTAGVIQSATVVDPGAVYVDLTAITTATQTPAHSGGAAFTFLRQDAVHDFGACNLVGWAAVCSARQWHGIVPWTCYEGVPTKSKQCLGSLNWVVWEPYRSTPPSTKYLKLVATVTHQTDITYDDSTPAVHTKYGQTRTCEVVESSGERLGTLSIPDGYDDPATASDPTTELATLVGKLLAAQAGAANFFSLFLQTPFGTGFTIDTTGKTISTDDVSGSATMPDSVDGDLTISSEGIPDEEFKYDFTNGIFYRHKNLHRLVTTVGTAPYLEDNNGTTIDVTSLSDTALQIDWTTFDSLNTGDEPGSYMDRITVYLQLSEPNTSATVTAEVDANMEPWRLLDRTMLPLTTNAFNGIMPKVSHNERQLDVQPILDGSFDGTMTNYADWISTGVWGKTAVNGWKDMQCYAWQKSDGSLSSNPTSDFASVAASGIVKIIDGSVLGQPISIDSGGNVVPFDPALGIPLTYFDPNFQGYEECDNLGWFTAYLHTYGEWCPSCATQMTNKWEGSALTFGRTRVCGPQFTPLTGIWAVKSIQTGVRYPALNHARPFGKDRWLVDELHVGCIAADGSDSSFTGTAGTLAGAVAMAPGDVWSFYGTGHDGTYQIDTVTGLSFTCHSLYGLPAGFTYWDNGRNLTDTIHGVMFKFRFPSCPPFGGRLAVQSVTAVDDSNGNHPGSHAGDPGQHAGVDYIPTCQIVTEATEVPMDEVVPSGIPIAVDFCGADMAALSSNKTPVTSSLTTFKVLETYATIAAAKWVVLYGALEGETTVNWKMPDASDHAIPKWFWNYDGWQGKHDGVGNMVKGEWTKDFRKPGEYARMNVGGWTANTAYALGFQVFDSGGNLWTVTQAGTSDPSTNPFTGLTPAIGNLAYDGGVIWTCDWISGCGTIFDDPPDCSGTNCYGYDPDHTTIADTCKGWVSCGPWYIVCSSHTADTPPTGQGIRADFADSYVAQIDPRYGSAQYLDFIQGMIDPIYQSPHVPCGHPAANCELADPPTCPPTCVPIVEARAVIPGSTGSTGPPDGGGGSGLNAVPPVIFNYTMFSPATHTIPDNVAAPPSPLTQPDSVYAPTGIYPNC